ncbi:O-antigen ligase family protein [Methylomonas methanica]|uniref:O-antigen ligase domain-containing protein n=1 Tax=Methylomonas methanica (strain DSM 25384 / MC09) TaxID=857087 RepID=F9ZVJ8_METMM|nr:hypothetical protein [Methylomonas methanica]AEG01980.1 hypothetical protein Metme_3619 [Methylomonas methanica MC09]
MLILASAFPVLDIVTAWLYGGGSPLAATLRSLRDVSIVVVAMLCLGTVRIPRMLGLPIVFYFAFVAFFLGVGLKDGIPGQIALLSAGTLVLPMFLFLVGYYCLRFDRELHTVLAIWILLALCSTVFGVWEIEHTEFWIDTIRFPEYMTEVKRVELGLDPITQLPWNFFRSLEMERRAAGLLAAPLAQGAFLAAVSVMMLALFAHRWRIIAVLFTGFMGFGIWQSGTRGAMIVAGVGVLGVLAARSGLLRIRRAWRWGVVGGLGGLALLLTFHAIYTDLSGYDSSTISHWNALRKNLVEFPQILVLGEGVGRQGAIAAQSKSEVIGGGEGAFFSIAFQLGLPGALIFLWFYVNCIRLLVASDAGERGLAWTVAVLLVGFSSTLVTSDHILTLSGMAAPWLMAGGAVRTAHLSRLSASLELRDQRMSAGDGR